jgi:hypothetical protein
MVQVVGGIIEARADDAAGDQPQAALAGAGLADTNPGAVGQDAGGHAWRCSFPER